jgi:glucose-1-phosphate thymidylyltransferase
VLSFLLFPVEHPESFDAVTIDENNFVMSIQVKQRKPSTNWVWGAFKMPGSVFKELYEFWCRPERRDEYFGTLVNAWLAEGGHAKGIRAGQAYVDTGTLNGYRAALRLLDGARRPVNQAAIYEEENVTADALITTNPS